MPQPDPHAVQLLYDGECPMCLALVRQLSRLGLTRRFTPCAWQDAGINNTAMAERIRVEVLLYDPVHQRIHGGLDALIPLLDSHAGWSVLGRTLRLPVVHGLGTWLYRLVAYNRRILSPPPLTSLPCPCDPPAHSGWQISLGILLITSILGSWLGMAWLVISPAPASLADTVYGLGLDWLWVWLPLYGLSLLEPETTARTPRTMRLARRGWQSLLISAGVGVLWLATACVITLLPGPMASWAAWQFAYPWTLLAAGLAAHGRLALSKPLAVAWLTIVAVLILSPW